MNSPFVKTPKLSLIIICLFLNCIIQTEPDEQTTFDTKGKYPASISSIDLCPSNVECSKLGNPCINCSFNHSCVYGSQLNVSCTVKDRVNCSGSTTFIRTMRCQYCYQTESWEHTCTSSSLCKAVASPRQYYTANCSVKSEIICLGKRRFLKRLPCNWTGGYRWRTALFLSIVLGGFGADRFYLGHWQEGIGKLFSFGGLGVWTLIDVILISLHYLGPADGSLYI